MPRIHWLWIASVSSAVVLVGVLTMRTAPQSLRFNRDVRPILAENCFSCHGPDASQRKGKLRLDHPEGLFKAHASGTPVVRGRPEQSALLQRLRSADPDEQMPPPQTHKKISAAQIRILEQWIEQGAPFEPHWAFVKPQRPKVPAVTNSAWVRTPVDAFVLAKLEAAGLAPAPDADRRALGRRLHLDLTGLPPTPDWIARFVQETSEEAYGRFVDELLGSPHYGEHRARYWLDGARYADTHGLHHDNYREIWPYRDWVIRAFNQNMRFDRFTIEQLAGDLLPNPTEDQLIATGFHRCNITTNECGVLPEEMLTFYARDRVETTAWVWLGLTANCAACHNHKFDPITQQDFYAMSAFFQNVHQSARDEGKRAPMPALVMPRPEDRAAWDSLPERMARATEQMSRRREALRPILAQWISTVRPADLDALLPHDFVPFGLRLDVLPDASGSATAAIQAGQAFSCGAWLELPKDHTRIFDAPGPLQQLPNVSLYAGDSGFVIHVVQPRTGESLRVTTQEYDNSKNTLQHVLITYDPSNSDGLKLYLDGYPLKQKLERLSSAETAQALTLQEQSSRQVEGRGKPQIFEGRFYPRVLSAVEVQRVSARLNVHAILAKPAKKRMPAENDLLIQFRETDDLELQSASAALAALRAEREAIVDRATLTPVMNERQESAPPVHVLFRGEYDKPTEKVEAGTIAALHSFPRNAPRNRLGLAYWLVSPENPLTARVTVNRFWQELFGTGLVKTTEDFGTMGDVPSNQELLDWLAVEFRDGGWNVKALLKTLVMSSTYRQAAQRTPEKVAKDPENRLLSRGPRFRMDAEMIRDQALAASGLLSRRVGGPSVKPYHPDGLWELVALRDSDTRVYVQDGGEKLYRRSVYTFWKRTLPPVSMEIFNAPTRDTSCVRRDRTNTPLQALVTLNDPQFVEAARVLAQNVLKTETARRLDILGLRLLARAFKAEERAILEPLVAELRTHYQEHPEQARALCQVGEAPLDTSLDVIEVAAWTMLCNQLLNLDEVLNK